MTPFVYFALIIAAIGSLGEQFIGVDSSDYSDHYLAASLPNMGADIFAGDLVGYSLLEIRKNHALQGRELQHAVTTDWLALDASDARNREFYAQWKVAGDAAERERIRQEWLASANAAKPIQQRFKRNENKLLGPEAGGAPEASGAPILRTSFILYALLMVEFIEQLAGFGPPCDGSELKAGSNGFVAVAEQLEEALPFATDDWQGMAACGHDRLNAQLCDSAQAIAELDCRFAAIVKAHADSVIKTRIAFAVLKALLAAAYAYELKADLLLPANEATAKALECRVAAVGIAVAVGMVLYVYGNAADRATATKDVIDGYNAITEGAAEVSAAAAVNAAGWPAVLGSVGAVHAGIWGPAGARPSEHSPVTAAGQPQASQTSALMRATGEIIHHRSWAALPRVESDQRRGPVNQAAAGLLQPAARSQRSGSAEPVSRPGSVQDAEEAVPAISDAADASSGGAQGESLSSELVGAAVRSSLRKRASPAQGSPRCDI